MTLPPLSGGPITAEGAAAAGSFGLGRIFGVLGGIIIAGDILREIGNEILARESRRMIEEAEADIERLKRKQRQKREFETVPTIPQRAPQPVFTPRTPTRTDDLPPAIGIPQRIPLPASIPGVQVPFPTQTPDIRLPTPQQPATLPQPTTQPSTGDPFPDELGDPFPDFGVIGDPVPQFPTQPADFPVDFPGPTTLPDILTQPQPFPDFFPDPFEFLQPFAQPLVDVLPRVFRDPLTRDDPEPLSFADPAAAPQAPVSADQCAEVIKKRRKKRREECVEFETVRVPAHTRRRCVRRISR